MKLTGQQRQRLNSGIVDAFDNRDELGRAVRYGLNERLNLIAPSPDFEQSVFELVEWAEREGRVEELVNALRAANPGNAGLREVAEELKLAADSSELEKKVIPSASFSDAVLWRERMSASELAVCRITINTGSGVVYGTGFLVGPDLVITNYHVMEDVIAHPALADRVELQFDFKRLADGKVQDTGSPYRLAADWRVDDSPNTPNWRPPTTDELDYALLRVEGTPGNDPVAGQEGAPPRKWLTPKDHAFAPQESLLIIQHPQLTPNQPTAPLQLALGIVDNPDPNADGTRVTYTTSTEGGASGSPAFTDTWKLVALHHAGNNKRNEGIPFAAILKRLEKKGLRKLLE